MREKMNEYKVNSVFISKKSKHKQKIEVLS